MARSVGVPIADALGPVAEAIFHAGGPDRVHVVLVANEIAEGLKGDGMPFNGTLQIRRVGGPLWEMILTEDHSPPLEQSEERT